MGNAIIEVNKKHKLDVLQHIQPVSDLYGPQEVLWILRLGKNDLNYVLLWGLNTNHQTTGGVLGGILGGE